MNKRFLYIISILAVSVLFGPASLLAKEPTDARKFPLRKVAGKPLSTLSNVNNFSMWAQADGMSGNDFITGKSRAIFPRGTALVIDSDGIVWAGLVNDGQLPRLRAGGSTYLSGTVQGAILGERTGIAEDPTAADVRIWRVREDWQTADLLQDAAESFDVAVSAVTDAQIAAVRAQYGIDWDEWPAVKGAPYYDDNGDGIYNPTIDRPGLAGADQVIWFVSNDLDTAIVANFLGSPPIGIENQVTIWAYASEGRLGDIIFRRNRLIYKGTVSTPSDATIDSMYLNLFSEPDIGDFGDDFVGVDTLLNTGYAYNSSDIDREFIKFGLAPAAVGYTLAQGPIVPSVGDKAIQDFSVRQDFKNLPLSAFGFNRAGDSISDPPHGRYEGTIGFYNVMHGLIQDGSSFIDPNTNEIAIFTLAGDPVAGTGWIDERPSNRVFEMSTGPFSMALGDTQEVIIALVGGIGASTFESIVEMKKTARLAISLGENMFSEIPEANLNITYPSGSEAILNLTVDAHGTAAEVIVEIFDYDDALMETLILSDDGNSGDGIANDSIWGIEWLTDQRTFGMYANALIVSGSDTTHWDHILDNITTLGPVEWKDLIIVDDNINNDGIINPGEKVIFTPVINNGSDLEIGPSSISTFILDEYVVFQGERESEQVNSISTGVTILAKDLSRFFVISQDVPENQQLTVRFSIIDKSNNVWVSELQKPISLLPNSSNLLLAEHIEGSSGGLVGWRISDLTTLTGDNYEITFSDGDHFNLDNLSTSTRLLDVEPIPSDTFSSFIPSSEGFKVVINRPKLAIKDWGYSAGTGTGERWFTGAGGGGEAMEGALFLDSTFWGRSTTKPIDYKTVEIRWGGMSGFVDGSSSFGVLNGTYDPGEYYTVDTSKPNQMAFMYKTWGAGNYTGFNPIPFEAWDVQDPANPRQLNVFVRDWSANAAEYGVGQWDYSFVGAGIPFEYIWIMATNYDPAGTLYDPVQGGVDLMNELAGSGAGKINAYYVMWFGPRSSHPFLADDGVLTIIPRSPHSANDIFRFNTTVDLVEILGIPETIHLDQNYPNPFNPETTIRYSLPMQSDVKLLIYNLLGQEVFRFEVADQKIGEYEVVWNGRNKRGNELSSGLYIYKFLAGDFVETRKMVLLK